MCSTGGDLILRGEFCIGDINSESLTRSGIQLCEHMNDHLGEDTEREEGPRQGHLVLRGSEVG